MSPSTFHPVSNSTIAFVGKAFSPGQTDLIKFSRVHLTAYVSFQWDLFFYRCRPGRPAGRPASLSKVMGTVAVYISRESDSPRSKSTNSTVDIQAPSVRYPPATRMPLFQPCCTREHAWSLRASLKSVEYISQGATILFPVPTFYWKKAN